MAGALVPPHGEQGAIKMQQVVKRTDSMTDSEQKLLAAQKLVLERVFNEVEGTEGATDTIVRIFRACAPDALACDAALVQ